jgi:serine/threonine protein kinase
LSERDSENQGELFGRYLVRERLGVGGMATVHRAKTRGVDGFETDVAVKRILEHLAEDEEFIASFVREAKLASLLHHPNIVRIHELGRIHGTYFMAMEYVHGHTLLEVLRWARVIGPPPNDVVVSLLIQLCDALEYAHTREDRLGEPLGIVHRDLSPSNLIIEHSGFLKVIDFGIAKAAPVGLRTESGMAKGKQGYMSPEALRARGVDARSDVYSTGVVAHELLTARRLFAVKDHYQTLQRIMHADVEPPSRYNPRCPPELDAIVLQALARDPGERWQSAGAMRDALEDLARQYELRPSSRAVADWLVQAGGQRSVMVRDQVDRDEQEFPSIVIVTPTPAPDTGVYAADPTTSQMPPATPMTPAARSPQSEERSYIVLETAGGKKLTLLEGPSRAGTDLHSLLSTTTPLPRTPTRWPRRGTLPPSVAGSAPAGPEALRTQWRKRDTMPPPTTDKVAPIEEVGAGSVALGWWLTVGVAVCAVIVLAIYLAW